MFCYTELVRGLVYIIVVQVLACFVTFTYKYFSFQGKAECSELTSSGVPIKIYVHLASERPRGS